MNADALPRLFNVTQDAIKDVFGRRNEFDEAINWGDLGCVETMLVHSYAPVPDDLGIAILRWEVLIEEASPDCPKFQAFIAERLAAAGFSGVIVRTEW